MPHTRAQVRRIVLLLPGALGRDQPAAKVPVLQHFQSHDAAHWDFAALTKVSLWRGAAADSCACGWLAGMQLPQVPSLFASHLPACAPADPAAARRLVQLA